MKPVQLETDRLLLRPFRLGDEAEILEWSSNAEVNQFTGDVAYTTLSEVKKLITDVWLSDYKKYGYGRFAVIYKPDNKLIGFCGIKYLKANGDTDLGYRFLPEYWGKGIATESSQLIVKYAFEEIGLERLVGFVMSENPASSAVLKKLGFQFTKRAPFPGEGEPEYDWYYLYKKDYER